MVDADKSLLDYFNKHLEKADLSKSKPYEVFVDVSLEDYLFKLESHIQRH